ncbi:MAG TPA: DUF5916 domain-containing protein [Acidobacteriota bacterium]|nr:DUF5916 domain-containing protein [Acidobacteriota bacterium]
MSTADRDRWDDLAITDADRQHQLEAVRASTPPILDGLLDDAVWAEAVPLTMFVQSQPDEGAEATERTEVRLLYDTEAIYISARMWDSNPDAAVATVLRRDENHNNNDAFAVTFDTYHDHRNGYFFETNALGARFDAQIIGEGGTSRQGFGATFNADWDAVWSSAGRIHADGWSVEIAIPFWVLRFDRANMDAWGINFRRTLKRNAEQDFWAPIPRQFNATRLSLSGMLVGMESVARPRNLQVKPFVLGDIGQIPVGPEAAPYSTHDTRSSGDLGGDIKWILTPNLTFDGTINTDFAQVEADDVQVNLTRFPLFFPEKREFFLENAGLFQFGSSSGRMGPRVIGFHSRSIGIFDGGEVPILAGARLTGKAGGWNIGALDMQTDSVDSLGLSSQNHGVLRVRRELGSRSNIGMLFTNQQASGSDYNRSLGFDGRLAIGGATIDGWWMKTETPEAAEDSESAGAVKFEWANSRFSTTASVMDVGESFNPGLGFVNRVGLRSYDSNVMWTPFFPDSPAVRNLAPHVSLSYVTDRHNRLLTRREHYDFDLFLRRGDKLSVERNRRFERLDLPFEIVPGVLIPPGEYQFDAFKFEAQSDQSRPLWGLAWLDIGDFWDGKQKVWRFQAGWRAGARFAASVQLDRNDIELPAGDFVADIWRARIAYDFNTRLFLSGLLQYDNITDQFLSNVRLNFIHTPGADLFLVYNERRLTEDPTLIDRSIILKFTQLFRL